MTIRDRAEYLLQRGWTKEKGWNFKHHPTNSKVELLPQGKMKVTYLKGKLQIRGKTFSDYDQLMLHLTNHP